MAIDRLLHLRGIVANYQITCAHGQCADPDCGLEYVFVGEIKVAAASLIEMAEAEQHHFWTMEGGQPVSVVVERGPDGRKKRVAKKSPA
jgi:hypothetical protein